MRFWCPSIPSLPRRRWTISSPTEFPGTSAKCVDQLTRKLLHIVIIVLGFVVILEAADRVFLPLVLRRTVERFGGREVRLWIGDAVDRDLAWAGGFVEELFTICALGPPWRGSVSQAR